MTDQNKPEDASPEEKSPQEPVESPSEPAKVPPEEAATAATGAGAGGDELPYIDDPVSKWWIAIIITVFALIFAGAILFGRGGLLSGIFDSDEVAASPEPTLVASPSPSPGVSASPEPSAPPTAEPTPEPTAEPTPEPTASPRPSRPQSPLLSRRQSPRPSRRLSPRPSRRSARVRLRIRTRAPSRTSPMPRRGTWGRRRTSPMPRHRSRATRPSRRSRPSPRLIPWADSHGVSTENGGPSPGDPFRAARKQMVRDQLQRRGIHDPATLAAMSLVPREAFVAPSQRARAYDDSALSIGLGQTISQPYMVARMTESLGFDDLGWPWIGERPTLLDIGTGSGYQAAVLAQTGARVTSIERDPQLAAEARTRLTELGYEVVVHTGDGSAGLAARAPYAGIVVGAGAPTIPPLLVDQLADGARLVIPVGPRSSQRLTVVQKVGARTITRSSDACVFVPLIGRHGHPG